MQFKRIIHLLLSAAITALLIYAVFQETSLEEIAEILSETDQLLLAVFASFSISGLLFRAWRYKVMLEAVSVDFKPPKFSALVVVSAIRNALVDFLPARLGEASYLYVLKSYGVRLSAGLSSFGLSLALDIVVLFLLLLSLFVYSSLGQESLFFQISLTSIAAITLTLVLVLSFFIYHLDKVVNFVVENLEKVKIGGARFQSLLLVSIDGLKSIESDLILVKTKKCYLKLVLLTVGLRFAKYASLYVLLIAVLKQWDIGFANVSAFLATLGFISAEAAASLPISGIMSFGAYEGAVSIAINKACDDCSIVATLTVALSVHLITQIFGYFWGILGLVVFWLRGR